MLSNKKHIKGLKGHRSAFVLPWTLHCRAPKKTVQDLVFFLAYFRVCILFLHCTLSSPSIILDHFFVHRGTLSGLKGPSWTFMDPKMELVRLISEKCPPGSLRGLN